MGGATPLKSQKFQNRQFLSETADFLHAGIFLHHINIQVLRFSNFTLKVGKMGGCYLLEKLDSTKKKENS